MRGDQPIRNQQLSESSWDWQCFSCCSFSWDKPATELKDYGCYHALIPVAHWPINVGFTIRTNAFCTNRSNSSVDLVYGLKGVKHTSNKWRLYRVTFSDLFNDNKENNHSKIWAQLFFTTLLTDTIYYLYVVLLKTSHFIFYWRHLDTKVFEMM